MKSEYQVGYATCRVGRCESVPASMRDGLREVSAVFVPLERRGNGDASKLMHEVCEDADAHRFVLLLHVEPYADRPMTEAALVSWYQKFGFMPIQNKPLLMARMVGSTPRVVSKVNKAIGKLING